MDVQHPAAAPVSATALAYERAAVLRYLDEADAARERLRGELDAALGHLRDLDVATPDTATGALAEELCDLTARLDEDRQATWSDVLRIVTDAQRESSAIVAAAQADARRLRTDGGPGGQVTGWLCAGPPGPADPNAGAR